MKLINYSPTYIYIVDNKKKTLSLELSIQLNGKSAFIKFQQDKIVFSYFLSSKSKCLYRLGNSLSVLYESLNRKHAQFLDQRFTKASDESVSSFVDNAVFISETSIPRYFYAKPDNFDFLKDGLKYYDKSKLLKLKSRDAWLTQFGRVIKVIHLKVNILGE